LEWRDTDRRGQSYARNQLIAAAIADGATHALFLDDDDEMLLPAPDIAGAITPETDILYCNWERRTRYGDFTIRLPAEAERVTEFGAPPWIFCARLSALELIRAAHGDVFPENQRYRVGGALWKRLLDAKLQFQHIPKTLLRHYQETDAAQLTRQPNYLEK
jgi:hypothetical protein